MRAGTLRHFVTLENPDTPVSDGDAGFTQAWTPLSPPQVPASIETATQKAMERLVANTVQAQATHIVRMRFHSGVTTKTRLTWVNRAGVTKAANVTFVDDVKERGVELVLLCQEVAA